MSGPKKLKIYIGEELIGEATPYTFNYELERKSPCWTEKYRKILTFKIKDAKRDIEYHPRLEKIVHFLMERYQFNHAQVGSNDNETLYIELDNLRNPS
jgi:hypothetical protein